MVYLRPRRTPLKEEIHKTKFDLCFTSTSFKTFSLDRLEAIQTEFHTKPRPRVRPSHNKIKTLS